MRWAAWSLALLGIAQYAVLSILKPTGYVSLDMAYLVMWLGIIAGIVTYALSWGCCYGSGCDCDHCEGCSGGSCCGECRCCSDDGHAHEHGEHGHEGHAH